MAGVAVDRYGFVYDRLTPPATGLSGLSVAALWRRTNHQSTSPGEVSAGTYVPLLLIPLLPRSSAGGYDPSRAAMAGVPVVMTPLSQNTQWLGPRGSASRDARWELSYPQVYHVITCVTLS